MKKKDNLLSPATTFALFNDAKIRREWHEGEWYFSIIDTIQALTGSSQPSRYWSELKNSIEDESKSDVFGKIEKLKMPGEDGKKYPSDVANTQTMLRLIQSIPSPKAEPFKQRLASIGNERIEEIDDPESGMIRARQRAIQAYKSKGMSDGDIKQRLDMIDSRNNFTDLLEDRGIHDKQYGILTNVGYSARAGMTAKEYKEFKGLDGKSDNLRDHMTKPEMLLAQISEEASKTYIENTGAAGFDDIQDAIKIGSDVAKDTRESFKKATGVDPVTPNNRLTDRQKLSRDKKKKIT